MFRCAAAVLVLVAACGDNLAGFPLEEVGLAIEEARCERLARCGVFATVDDCTARVRLLPNPSLLAAVAEGSIRYWPMSLDECLATLAAASCNETLEDARTDVGACTAIFVGTRTAGAACELDEQCVDDRCEQTGCGIGQCCTGTCADARAPLGGACDADEDCASDGRCDASGQCIALAAVGESCARDHHCEYGAACIGAGVEPGTCRTLPLVGERCLYARCAEVDAVCAEGTCVAAGAGASCTSDAACSAFGYCAETAICAPYPTLGEPCVTRCTGAAFCDRSAGPGTCAPLLPAGSPCATGDACASGFCEEGAFFDQCRDAPVCS